MKVAVVGLGLIGGSMALELRAKHFAEEIIGVDSNAAHASQAIELGLIDRAVSLDQACKSAELMILSMPVSQILRLLPEILNVLKPTATLIDVGSTKEKISEGVSLHPNRPQFVASHPMAGTEYSGPSAAKIGLFKGKAAVICDRAQSGESSLKLVLEVYELLGMRLIFMDSKAHDLHAAYVSHLSHITSFVLANTVLNKEKNTEAIFDLASGGFESTVRLAKSSPAMWAPIFEQNCDQVSEALGAYIEQLNEFRQALVRKDFNETERLMTEANRIDRVLSKLSRKGNPS